ncbi:MAG: 7-carboxy-7-deazaguanine synthase QueE [Nitrosopumilus sp.]|nr:7-carboxy-7-deazaguanine synthase QueE [Nitrosopumilus sp.]
MLNVNEIFYSIQCEGPFTGVPATFIRLSGCNLTCEFCDTDHVDYTSMSTSDILHAIDLCSVNSFFVITGGEPFKQNISYLIEALLPYGKVQIETNGVLPPDAHIKLETLNKCDIVVSPKTNKVNEYYLNHAVYWKYLIDCNYEFNNSPIPKRLVPPPMTNKGVFLQPMLVKSDIDNLHNISKTVELCKLYRVRLSLQGHKYIGIR